ncbi:hypothetical protein [Sphingomonas sp. PAMC 26605]|uniref:hypothetical protein n=1 Tax=Sphingomonas sp. PAMC 26605 TaxID=1112214 RepID=UPI00026CDD4A|nr:hypothetical protein [Sphingomonas sp. PAMC 26605]
MMRTDPFAGPRNVVSAGVLVLAGVLLSWLCVRSAALQLLAPDAPALERLAPRNPERVLAAATLAIVQRRGLLDAATLDAVRAAARAAPLDARAFLILGHQQLLDRRPRDAVATLRAGQRLDPRQRLIHLLLLDQYLRTGRYGAAAEQFSVLARLVSTAQAPIAQAMAVMSQAPATRDAVRRTLATNPRLERDVLVALARADTPPASLFALASPAAIADAGDAESWGPVLIARLVAQQRYGVARAAWARVYWLTAAQTDAPIFDAALRTVPKRSAFDWSLAAGSLGAADIRDGALAIDYYGRDSGDLASQLLVLKPGRYRFAFGVDPGSGDTAPRLFWSLACASGDKAKLMDVPVLAAAGQRRIAAEVVVPASCPAQMLALRGEAGDLPAPVSVTIRDVTMHARPGAGS